MRTYELVLVVQPGLDEEGLDAYISSLIGVVTDAGGQLVDVEHMGRRRLAYPIKKATEGHYVLLHLNMENPALVETERRIKLAEEVLRYLVIRMDDLMEPAPPQEPEPPEAAAEAPTVDASVAEDADADDLATELADELAGEGSDS